MRPSFAKCSALLPDTNFTEISEAIDSFKLPSPTQIYKNSNLIQEVVQGSFKDFESGNCLRSGHLYGELFQQINQTEAPTLDEVVGFDMDQVFTQVSEVSS